MYRYLLQWGQLLLLSVLKEFMIHTKMAVNNFCCCCLRKYEVKYGITLLKKGLKITGRRHSFWWLTVETNLRHIPIPFMTLRKSWHISALSYAAILPKQSRHPLPHTVQQSVNKFRKSRITAHLKSKLYLGLRTSNLYGLERWAISKFLTSGVCNDYQASNGSSWFPVAKCDAWPVNHSSPQSEMQTQCFSISTHCVYGWQRQWQENFSCTLIAGGMTETGMPGKTLWYVCCKLMYL